MNLTDMEKQKIKKAEDSFESQTNLEKKMNQLIIELAGLVYKRIEAENDQDLQVLRMAKFKRIDSVLDRLNQLCVQALNPIHAYIHELLFEAANMEQLARIVNEWEEHDPNWAKHRDKYPYLLDLLKESGVQHYVKDIRDDFMNGRR